MTSRFGRVALAGLLLMTGCSIGGATAVIPQAEPPAPSSPPPPPAVPPPVVKKETAASTTAFTGTHRYADGVQVKVLRIKRTKLTDGLRAKNVKKRAPVQILTVQVENKSRSTVGAARATGTMNYGRAKTAAAVRGKGIRPALGTIRPGAVKKATLAFAVPKSYIANATLRFNFDPDYQAAVFTGSLDYSPSDSTVFNDPTGSKDEQYSIINHIERSIDAAPPGSTIRIAQYAFDVHATAKKLVAAHKRGVNVQMLVDRHKRYAAMPWEDYAISNETEMLTELLGDDVRDSSFVTMCGASCMSNRKSSMHAKFYLFSHVGSSRLVSMVGSANITSTNSKGSWNNIHTVVGDAKVYNSLAQYFIDMVPDKRNLNYYRTTASGKYKLYMFPRRAGKNSAVLLDVLDNISCTGAAPGYGKGGRTVIRIAMYSWTTTRLDLAKKTWDLHNKGCRVEVIYNSGRTSPSVNYQLLKRSAEYGMMPVFDAWVDRNYNDRAERYMHHKALTVNGVWFGRSTKMVYTGSQNFTANATQDNNDIVFRIQDDAIHDAYMKNFDYIRELSPRRTW